MNKKNKLKWQIPFLLFLIIGSFFIVKNNHVVPYQHNHGFVFGTMYNITYQCDSDLQKSIEQALKEVDQSLSPFNKQSVISHINRNEDMRTDTLFNQVFRLAEQVAAQTNGAFDITVAPLVNAWGFGFKKSDSVTVAGIDSLRSFVGFHKVKLQDGIILKQDHRTMLDCSAIAKGFGCDHVAQLLDHKKVKNYMIEIGGEIVVKGQSEKGSNWNIGICQPVDDSLAVKDELQNVVKITNMAMATSGNYRNFYYKEGKKYAHTIDPRTGYPVQHSILSATVFAPTCAMADAFATSFMVLGLDSAKTILAQHKELMGYLIYANHDGNNQVYASPQLKKLLNK